MIKSVFMRIFLFLIITLVGYQSGCVLHNSHILEHKLVGRWSSSLITYPDDPIFNNAGPITEPGRAVFLFQRDRRFMFNWDETNANGCYHVKGQNLILIIDNDRETVECLLDLKGNFLTIEMDDGFRFELRRKE